jgi:hypothetical protein
MNDIVTKLNNHYQPTKRSLHWYRRAFRFSKELAAETGQPLRVVVGVVAALSPNNRWERNKIDARNFILSEGTSNACTFFVQRDKAWKILHEQPSEKEIAAILKGDKTISFFHNILHPYTNGKVTIDMWAIRAAGFCEKKVTVQERRDIKQAYYDAAKSVGVRAHEYQAVVWESVRNSNAKTRA